MSDERLDGYDGYHCLYCGRYLEVDKDGLIIHDDVEHPADAKYDEDKYPQ